MALLIDPLRGLFVSNFPLKIKKIRIFGVNPCFFLSRFFRVFHDPYPCVVEWRSASGQKHELVEAEYGVLWSGFVKAQIRLLVYTGQKPHFRFRNRVQKVQKTDRGFSESILRNAHISRDLDDLLAQISNKIGNGSPGIVIALREWIVWHLERVLNGYEKPVRFDSVGSCFDCKCHVLSMFYMIS